MKAVVIREHGSLEQLDIADVPHVEAAPGEVRIAVRAAALNHLDIWVRKGRPGMGLDFPHILGSDAAGVVEEVGSGVKGIHRGEEVILNPGISCGHCAACLAGEQSECAHFTIVGLGRPGAFAEYVTVPAANVQPRPAHLSWEEAAALPLAYLTAWRMLHSRARIRPGESVLIHGIGGGVALAALQLVGLAGGEAVVTSSSEDKLERARELGAAHTINYKTHPNVAEQVLAWTKGRGVDIALDAVGAATWPINLEALRKGGRAVHCGVTTGAVSEANISAIYWKQLSILGSTMGSQEDFRSLVNLVRTTGLKPVVDKVYPLGEARSAQGRMDAGEQFGKIVLSVAS